MPTRSSTSTARFRASFWLSPRWMMAGSAIWVPTVIVGFSDVIGSWKIIETLLPRTRRMSLSLSVVSSLPSSLTLPEAIRPPGGSSRMSDIPVIDLPHPDSPTSPTVSPGAMLNETSRTAWTAALRVRISVRSPATSSSGVTDGSLAWPTGASWPLQLGDWTGVERQAHLPQGDLTRLRHPEHVLGDVAERSDPDVTPLLELTHHVAPGQPPRRPARYLRVPDRGREPADPVGGVEGAHEVLDGLLRRLRPRRVAELRNGGGMGGGGIGRR